MTTGVVDPDDPVERTISFNCEPYLLYDNKKEFSVTSNNLQKGNYLPLETKPN